MPVLFQVLDPILSEFNKELSHCGGMRGAITPYRALWVNYVWLIYIGEVGVGIPRKVAQMIGSNLQCIVHFDTTPNQLELIRGGDILLT